jgi:hypothetical protein
METRGKLHTIGELGEENIIIKVQFLSTIIQKLAVELMLTPKLDLFHKPLTPHPQPLLACGEGRQSIALAGWGSYF